MLNFARSLVQSVTGVASHDFDAWVDARSDGKEHAPFFAGSFPEAVRAAAERTIGSITVQGRGLVLLWLHEADDDNTTQLCREVWPHPGVLRELSSRFIAWAGDSYRYEASSLARLLRIRTFPTLIVIQNAQRGSPGSVEWPRGTHFRILWHASGRISGDGLHAVLVDLAETCDRGRQQEDEWRRSMRQMQDLSQSMIRSISDAQADARRQAERVLELRNAEEDERSCFAGIFESKYGVEPPPFFEGSFQEALAAARKEKRLLLVWLYGNTPTDDVLCNEVFISETQVFKAFITEYFVMWPGDAERWLRPVQLRELLRLPGVPVLLVLQPLNVYEATIVPWGDPSAGSPVEFPADSAWSLLGSWNVATAGSAEDEIMAFLAEHGDKAVEDERKRQEALHWDREAAAEARALREQQDIELQESIEADNARAERGDASNELADGGARRVLAPTPAETAALAAQTVKDEAKTALVLSRRADAEQLLTIAAPTGKRCELVLRLPSGRRATRVFNAEDNLSVVYAWAACSGELVGLQGSECFEVPQKFKLATSYPRAVLRNPEDVGRSLQDLGLVPNAVILLCPEDD